MSENLNQNQVDQLISSNNETKTELKELRKAVQEVTKAINKVDV
jgi:response regulator of citrate/malate metabolism